MKGNAANRNASCSAAAMRSGAANPRLRSRNVARNAARSVDVDMRLR